VREYCLINTRLTRAAEGANVIVSVHLADVGGLAALRGLRRRPDPSDVPGLRYADTVIAAPLGGGLLPVPQFRRVGLVAAWDDDRALDAFLASDPLAELLAAGWHVRLEPLRASGAWSALPDLPEHELPVDDDEPVAVLTLGRLRFRRVASFLRTSASAEEQAVADPALLAATGLARPPGLVATFSLWRTAESMRAYAYGQSGSAHLAAIRAHRSRPFHRQSVFARFRPYGSQGAWDGRDPLAPEVARAT
jgi:hypothetical protein